MDDQASASTIDSAGSQPRPEADSLQLGPLSDLLGYHLAHAVVATTAMFERHIGQPFGLSKVESRC